MRPQNPLVRFAADGAASAPQRVVCWAPSRPSTDEQDGFGANLPAPEDQRTTSAASDMPYPLRHLTIDRPNRVWSCERDHIPMGRGFLHLVAIMDWFSRRGLAWRLSKLCGCRLLRYSARRSPASANWYLQLGSGLAVHQLCLHQLLDRKLQYDRPHSSLRRQDNRRGLSTQTNEEKFAA